MDTSPPQSSEEKRERKRAYNREWYAKNHERARETDRRWKEKNRERRRAAGREYDRNRRGTQVGKAARTISQSRARAKRAGIEHTITAADLEWPTHCPVLGIELNYAGGEGSNQGNSASLDRHDNSLGYVPGNVRVISYRANTLKRDATPDELMAVARYAKYGAAPPELADIW